jgi:hypothetical protein
MALRQTYLSMKKKLPNDAEVVLVMRGRGNDELAPSKELLDEYKRREAECAKTAKDSTEAAWCAYEAVDYERRFRALIDGNPASRGRLKRLSEESRERDVFLICYEGEDKPCHRKLLLKIAEEEFGAEVDPSPFLPRE